MQTDKSNHNETVLHGIITSHETQRFSIDSASISGKDLEESIKFLESNSSKKDDSTASKMSLRSRRNLNDSSLSKRFGLN